LRESRETASVTKCRQLCRLLVQTGEHFGEYSLDLASTRFQRVLAQYSLTRSLGPGGERVLARWGKLRASPITTFTAALTPIKSSSKDVFRVHCQRYDQSILYRYSCSLRRINFRRLRRNASEKGLLFKTSTLSFYAGPCRFSTTGKICISLRD